MRTQQGDRPTPRALRLVCALAGARPPPPPFGLPAYVDTPDAALAIVLDVDPGATARAQVDLAAAQIPQADAEPNAEPNADGAGRLVVVLAARALAGGFFARMLGQGRAPIPPEVRATALLARGYVNLGSDGDVVWGEAPLGSTTRPS